MQRTLHRSEKLALPAPDDAAFSVSITQSQTWPESLPMNRPHFAALATLIAATSLLFAVGTAAYAARVDVFHSTPKDARMSAQVLAQSGSMGGTIGNRENRFRDRAKPPRSAQLDRASRKKATGLPLHLATAEAAPLTAHGRFQAPAPIVPTLSAKPLLSAGEQ